MAEVQKDKATKEHCKLFFKDWMENNIFLWKKWDSIAYFALFIIIPIAVTWISLSTLSSDNISKAYCYVTIFISAINSLYDCASRWKKGQKSLHNTKIFFIILSNTVIAVYCTIVILYILITKELNMRFDWIFIAYLIAIVITMFDIIACFAQEMAIRSYIKEGGK